MKLKPNTPVAELPIKLKELAIQRMKDQNQYDIHRKQLHILDISNCFVYSNTPEGSGWWNNVNRGAEINDEWGGEPINEQKQQKMEQEFVLPAKWCVRRNKTTHQAVNQWFNQHSGQKRQFSGWNAKEGNDHWHYPKLPTGFAWWQPYNSTYTLITYNQFLQYVVGLNSNVYEIY